MAATFYSRLVELNRLVRYFIWIPIPVSSYFSNLSIPKLCFYIRFHPMSCHTDRSCCTMLYLADQACQGLESCREGGDTIRCFKQDVPPMPKKRQTSSGILLSMWETILHPLYNMVSIHSGWYRVNFCDLFIF